MPQRGLIAILDALGAATYSDPEMDRFLESRDLVLEKLNKRAEAGQIEKARLRVFTFNDTVVIVYLAVEDHDVTLDDIATFSIRLRALLMHSMENRILFRGSISIGKFRLVDDATNTVMGEAVSDAAAWYDKADWIGIAATPHASMFIDALIEREGKTIDSLLVDYDVPLKARPPIDGLQRVAGLPVQVAAERLGVSRSTVKRWRRQVGGLLTKVAR